MFRGLVAPPPTSSEAFQALKRKVEAHALEPPPVYNFHRACPRAALTRIEILEGRIGKYLDFYERWATDPGRRPSIRVAWHKNRIDEAMAEARRLVRAIKIRKAARYFAAVRIQRTALRVLYQPRTGNVPRISRALIDEGFLVIDDGDADDACITKLAR